MLTHVAAAPARRSLESASVGAQFSPEATLMGRLSVGVGTSVGSGRSSLLTWRGDASGA
ncbi:hypothetical protein [Streptomyces sp. NPDC056987]|uniref:hypothetical protein n=1 Tax=Streptomyces sp. NPDC056987 TaxID=3345988 RepID=UPI0036341313